MKTTLIIPTLNEVGSVESVLREIPKEKVDEILVVDGYSKDGTIDLVKKLGYSLVFQEGKGFGAAINTGIKYAKGDVIVILNADGSQNPKDIPLLLQGIKEGNDLVLASRFIRGGGSEDVTLLRRMGNKFFTFLCNAIYGMNISDCLYFFLAARKNIFGKIKPNILDFGYCIEVPIKVHKAGLRIAEIPSFEKKRTSGKQKTAILPVGFKTLWALLKQL